MIFLFNFGSNTCCPSNTDTLDAKVPQEKIRKLYDGTAWFYDVWATLFNRILIRNPNGRNVGIDISKGMLAKAKSLLSKQPNSNYSLDIGSAFDIKMDDLSVDILFNNYMFDLIPFDQMDTVINEFSRVLKPGGKLVLVNMTKAEQFGAGLYERIYQISPTLMGGCRGVQLSKLLTEHGFIIENREYIQQMLFPSEVILATR